MCVTTGAADMTHTMVYGFVPPIQDGVQRHVVGYQNEAASLTGLPNCMLLNYAGTDLRLVNGPQYTKTMMADMTGRLKGIEEVRTTRVGAFSYGVARVENYGDYTVVISQSAAAIGGILRGNEIPSRRRPVFDKALSDLLDFFGTRYPNDTFVLACFDGHAKVKPTHPIVVSYEPRQPEYITVPGLDGHDGKIPQVGAPVFRDFKVAFGAAGVNLFPVKYRDRVNPLWAPTSGVIGFVDNRDEGGPNGNYCLPVAQVREYEDPRTDESRRRRTAPGTDLIEHLVLGNL